MEGICFHDPKSHQHPRETLVFDPFSEPVLTSSAFDKRLLRQHLSSRLLVPLHLPLASAPCPLGSVVGLIKRRE